MSQNPAIVFVCEHGAAKSVIAAACFNHVAQQMGKDVYAVARGTNPDKEFSSQALQGLSKDGLATPDSSPQKLTQIDLESAQRVVAFCPLPEGYEPPMMLERWEDIPSVSDDYEKAREAIVKRVRQLLNR
jgi:protein-tyrosine-phosphatase